MPRTDFGDCIGCEQPIRPPYLTFKVSRLEQPRGHDAQITEWEEVDVCSDCAGTLTAEDLHRLVATESPAAPSMADH